MNARNTEETRKYSVGCNEDFILEERKNSFTYSIKCNDLDLVLTSNNKNKSYDLFEKKKGQSIPYEGTGITKGVTKQLKDDGSRWEGDWLNGKPFGFGSLYDGEGNRIYSGFMIDGKKIGYGTEYFADNHMVDYCGSYMNDLRHGRGCSYDKNDTLKFEGDWILGSNIDFVLVVKEKYDDMYKMNSLLREITIEDNCFSSVTVLYLKDYTQLSSLTIGKKCFQKAIEFHVQQCNKLQTITIGSESFVHEEMSLKSGCFQIEDCEQLQLLRIGTRAFRYYSKRFELTSIT